MPPWEAGQEQQQQLLLQQQYYNQHWGSSLGTPAAYLPAAAAAAEMAEDAEEAEDLIFEGPEWGAQSTPGNRKGRRPR